MWGESRPGKRGSACHLIGHLAAGHLAENRTLTLILLKMGGEAGRER